MTDETLTIRPGRPAADELLGDRLAERLRGYQVGVEHAGQVGRRHPGNTAPVALAYVVDQDVDRPRHCHRPQRGVDVGDVERGRGSVEPRVAQP